jgi:type IV secretion system protein VirB3
MIRRDPIFKGCTRPSAFGGVPLTPLLIVWGAETLFAFYTNIFFIGLLIPSFYIMRIFAKNDDQIFRLLGMRIAFRSKPGSKAFWRVPSHGATKIVRKF